MTGTRSELGERIAIIKEPYKKVVGGNNTPPQSLRSLARTTAGSKADLVALYEDLCNKQEQFNELRSKTPREDLLPFFDPHPRDDEQFLTFDQQDEKWFEYPKLRILAVFEEFYHGIPDRDALEGAETIHDDLGSLGLPEEEISLVLLLDEYASLDTEDPATFRSELERDDRLGEFVYTTYRENRDINAEITNLDRAGVKSALREAYEERIAMLNQLVEAAIEDVGADEFGETLTAAADLHSDRVDIEETIAGELDERIGPRLEAIERGLDALVDAHEDGPNGTELAALERQLHDLRQDIQQWALTESSDLESVTAQLNDLIDDLERTLADERFESSDALTDIRTALKQLQSDVAELPDQVEEEVATLYKEQGLEAIEGEYQTDREELRELALLSLLVMRLEALAGSSDRTE